jgi:RNA polymerase sigma-70 factor (ECF subfamily)
VSQSLCPGVFVTAPVLTDEKLPGVSLEHELIARARDGDGRAFASLVEPHLAVLYRITARACGDRALAEDAVQDALTLAYERLSTYQPGTSFRAFLAAYSVRKAQTLLRGERRRRAREESSDPPEHLPGPAELVRASHAAERVRAALSRLPEKRRAAAMLRLDAELSYAEIAQAVGSTEGSARVLVHMALKELREQLADLVTGEETSEEP